MAWQEAFIEDIKTTHRGLPVAEICQCPLVRELRKLVLKSCLKYCQKGKMESHRGPVVFTVFLLMTMKMDMLCLYLPVAPTQRVTSALDDVIKIQKKFDKLKKQP